MGPGAVSDAATSGETSRRPEPSSGTDPEGRKGFKLTASRRLRCPHLGWRAKAEKGWLMISKTRVSVTLTKPYLDALDRLIEEGGYVDRGEAIMEALRRLFRHYGIKPFARQLSPPRLRAVA